MPTKSEIAARIKEGTRKRQEDQRRRQQLQHEYLADVRGQRDEEKPKGPVRYLSCIFVTLLFISFPLSERVVDWTLVGLFCGLNLFWVILLRDPSDWLNILTMILSNLLLVQWSPHVYEIPVKLSAAPKDALVGYVGANALLVALLYYCYVERNWFRVSACPPAVAPSSTKDVDDNSLDMYIRRREKSARADWALCWLVVGNVVLLVLTGVIPTEVVTRVAQGWMRLLQ